MKFKTGLTDTEIEALGILAEEMGEALQIIGKIIRHGLDSCHPDGGPVNRELLEAELGDVVYAKRLVIETCGVSEFSIANAAAVKCLTAAVAAGAGLRASPGIRCESAHSTSGPGSSR